MHTTPRVRALGHDFAVRAEDPALVAWLASVFSPLSVEGHAADLYHLQEDAEGCSLRLGDEIVCEAATPDHAVAMLLWHVNQRAVAASSGSVLVHAAGVAVGDTAVVLPAPPNAGKTTLAAGLVAAGFDYLSDEVVALDPETLVVRPHPKALSIDVGAQRVLPHLAPVEDPATARWLPTQWQVQPDRLRPGAVATGAPVPRLLVAPRYQAGAATRAEPMSRADGLLLAADSTFRFGEHGARDVEVLARVVRGCECYRLSVGDLDAAVDAVAELVAQLPVHHRRAEGNRS